MGEAKKIILRPIPRNDANALIKRVHYSGKVCNNTQLHIGVFYQGRLEGALQFGPSLDKRKMLGLVKDTKWNEFIELHRLAFTDALPRNSESRAISIAMRIIKKRAPHVKWIISFADGVQCGDGTIYRASGFILTQIKKNSSIIKLTDGSVHCNLTFNSSPLKYSKNGKASKPEGSAALAGFQLRYIFFQDAETRAKLTVPEIPFCKIKEMGASMYKGNRVGDVIGNIAGLQPENSGSIPTPTLQKLKPGANGGANG